MRQVLLGAALLILSAGVALGADRDSARDHYVKGTRAYELGLYDQAIAEYMAAYKLKDDPAFLFNLGQAHRLANHPAEALRFYKTYLLKLPAASNRAEVEAKMADLTRRIEQQKQPAPVPSPASAPESHAVAVPPADASPASTSPTVAPAMFPPPAAVAQATPGETPRAGRGMRLAGIASAAGGLALAATGIVFGVLAKQAGDDLTQLDERRGVFDPSKESTGQRDQILAGVFIGIGAAAMATGAILYVLGSRGGQEASQSFVVSPSVAAHSAGAILRAVF